MAVAAGEEEFTTTTPAKLYEQDPSHPGTASATPGLLNGYCVAVQNEGNAPITPVNHGFTVENGSIVDTDAYTADTPTTTDDIYCVIVQSDAGVTSMKVQWFFSSPGDFTQVTELDVEVFHVDLAGVDGFVGGRALVCTDGWDPDLLTGSASNDFASQTEPLPDPLDKVAVADWILDPGPLDPAILGDPFKEGEEWCIAIGGSAVNDIDVTLQFDIVHNRNTNADDIAHTTVGTDIVDIAAEPPFSELRHVNAAGQMIETQDTTANAVGATHYACIIPSDSDDTLSASDIHFGDTGTSGTVTEVFHNTAGRFVGVPDGTLCFGFRSSTPGYHFVSLSFEKVGGPNPGVRQVSWDVDGNCNDDDADTDCTGKNTALLKHWQTLSRTVITRGNDFTEDIVTNSTITEGVRFNVANGTWLLGSGRALTYTEWTLGPGDILLTGARLELRITSQCGFFVDEDDATVSLGKTISGESYQGRFDRIDAGTGEPFGDGPDDFHISVTGDGGCRPGESIQVEIDALSPGGDFIEQETLTIQLNDVTPDRTIVPILAWAGQTVTIPYAFAVPTGGACADENNTIHFVRSQGPGAFLPSPGLENNGPDHLFGQFTGCSRTARYESEDIGQVDIEVFVDGNPYSKIVFVIFYMAIEDVTMFATPELFVSERGDVSATVRGWFVNSNPSGRPPEVKDDGRAVPENRWVLPDDWDRLRGLTDSDLRQNWPGTPPMPLTDVTFLMVDEEKVNSFAAGAFDGALGFFMLDGTESSINVNPRTGQPSALGSTAMPRIITDLTDGDGVATVDSYGDFNVGYADCEANSTGSPYCRVDDYVGSTLFYAVADYPGMKGKWPPVASNVAETRWLWAGYKGLSIVDTDSPTIKYVVAHLRDRDGFCDAVGFNNVLGIPVEFLIDGGEGKILEVAGEPSFLSGERKRAVGTSFDILSDTGQPLNEDLAVPPLSDDECQVWVKIANSMRSVTNLMVTFPANPVPIPAEVRITGLQCTGTESVTVTNFGSAPVSLAGFGINSPPSDIYQDWEHLGLIGLLGPGESRTFFGGPGAEGQGWIFAKDLVFDRAGDFASLRWNGFELSRAWCDGTLHQPDLPATLPPSGEGQVVLDILVPFNEQVEIHFAEGWNLVTLASDRFLDELLEQHGDDVLVVYRWDARGESWERLFPNQPLVVSNLVNVQPGSAYWVQVKRSFTLRFVP